MGDDLALKSKILIVGLTTIDVINYCDGFPTEDSDNNVFHQRIVKGGNAANTACVLAQLGIEVDLFSCLSSLRPYKFVIDELVRYGVNIDLCSRHSKTFPTTSCIVNMRTGSRTLLHSPSDLPWISVEDFRKIDISKYNLIHFEGRGFPDTGDMIAHALNNRWCNKPLISGEMENVRRIKDLDTYILPNVDILFVSKDVAKFKGYENSKDAVVGILCHPVVKAKYVICPWGELGASAATRLVDGADVANCAAICPEKVVDTLGAGDTFIGGVLSALLKGQTVLESIQRGCFIAGKKCGQFGLDNLCN